MERLAGDGHEGGEVALCGKKHWIQLRPSLTTADKANGLVTSNKEIEIGIEFRILKSVCSGFLDH